MNSLTTDAMAIPLPLPLDTRCPVERSSTTVVMSAPFAAASAVACLVRSSRPSKAAAGSSGGASGRGASGPCGATTVSCGASGSTGGGCRRPLPHNRPRPAPQAVTATSLDGRRRIRLLQDVPRGERALLTRRPPVTVQPNRWAAPTRPAGPGRVSCTGPRFHCMRPRLAQLGSCLCRTWGRSARPPRDAPDTPESIGAATRNHRESAAGREQQQLRKSHR